MRVLGIDEAGRGCVLGSLVVGGFCAPASAAAALREAGAADSKKLSPARREAAREALAPLGEAALVEVTAGAIDGGNINRLEEEVFLQLIRQFRPEVVQIDAPTHPRGIPKLLGRLRAALAADGLDPQWVVEPKADATYPHVGAASIFAKTDRDARLDALRATWGALGSGYPSDPKTRAWLSARLRTGEPLPDFVRTRWGTLDALRQQALFPAG